MQTEATNQPDDLLTFGVYEICGDPANTLTRDLIFTVLADYPNQHPMFGRAVEKRFCEAHRRSGKMIVEREPEEVYFARLRTTEGAEI